MVSLMVLGLGHLGSKVGHGYNRGYRKVDPHPYPPNPYPARVGYKTRAGKPAVPQRPAGRPTRRGITRRGSGPERSTKILTEGQHLMKTKHGRGNAHRNFQTTLRNQLDVREKKDRILDVRFEPCPMDSRLYELQRESHAPRYWTRRYEEAGQ
ncbi:hypothetical protein B0H14DRAFT_3153973, partial [Mycena olivaceomarginata]